PTLPFTQRVVTDPRTTRRRMDDPILAGVDRDVIDVRAVVREEQQVARTQRDPLAWRPPGRHAPSPGPNPAAGHLLDQRRTARSPQRQIPFPASCRPLDSES